MIEFSVTQFLVILSFLAITVLNLVLFIYKNQSKRIDTVEATQKDCPINKIYSIVEVTKTDVTWIKEALKKKT